MNHGKVAYFRGYKLIYVNSADLLKIEEVNWKSVSNKDKTYLRKALLHRLCKLLEHRENYRNYEAHKLQPKKTYYTGRIKNPRKSILADDLPQPPIDLQVDDHVTVINKVRTVYPGRIGIIKQMHFSNVAGKRVDGTKRKGWMAKVEFPKLKQVKVVNERVKYTIPFDCLMITVAPIKPKQPLSQDPEAIRGRKRKPAYTRNKEKNQSNFNKLQKAGIIT